MKAASSIFTALSAAVFGFFIGISFPVEITPKVSKYIPYIHVQYICLNLLDGSIFIYISKQMNIYIYIYICACSFSIVPFSLATVQTRTPAPAVTATTTCSTSGHHPSETALVPRRMPLFQGYTTTTTLCSIVIYTLASYLISYGFLPAAGSYLAVLLSRTVH